MRVPVLRLLAFTVISAAAPLAGGVLAQRAEEPEEITVRGQKSLGEYRLELERAREEVFRQFNEANKGNDTDIRCRDEQPTGSRMAQNVCRSAAENRSDSAAARDFLSALLMSAGNYRTYTCCAPPGTQVAANIGTGEAQGAGQSGEADALAKFEQEWNRLLTEDRQFYRAVVKYVEIEDEYNKARGVATEETLQVPVAAVTVSQPSGPQCEATTLTEYFQRNTVARVSGTISLASCPAGTAGSYNVVARVRDDSGEIKPIEFSETWQRADAGDVIFNSDYPIGESVELVNVRVRDLKCTCAAPVPAATP